MRKILLILLLPILLLAQFGGYGGWNGYISNSSKLFATDSYTVANWLFDDTYHPDWKLDLTTNNNDLTESAGFEYTNQMVSGSPIRTNGNVQDFDGGNDYFFIPGADATDFNFGTGDFTIEIWFKISTTNHYSYFFCNGTNAEFRFVFGIHDANKVRFVTVDNNITSDYITSVSEVCDGEWHYVAMVRSYNGMNTIYVDGVAETTAADKGVDMTYNGEVNIGKLFPIGYYYPGQIASIRISNKARTAAEINAYWRKF